MGSFIWRTLRGDILRVAAAVAEKKINHNIAQENFETVEPNSKGPYRIYSIKRRRWKQNY